MAMKKALAVAALAAFGLSPVVGMACEYNDASSASAAPAVQVGLAQAPAATMVPTPTVAKAVAPNAAKQVSGKVKAPVPDQKVAVGATN
jgi:hypothetical protein